MPLVFIFVAALFWLTLVTVFAIGWLLRMMFHVFAASMHGARGLISRSQAGAHG
ncbi:MAG TPA: hypothetical protein VFU74_07250 [Actinocrinis sp.]|nr:hypothetical protein [Actinocrinis sp.]